MSDLVNKYQVMEKELAIALAEYTFSESVKLISLLHACGMVSLDKPSDHMKCNREILDKAVSQLPVRDRCRGCGDGGGEAGFGVGESLPEACRPKLPMTRLAFRRCIFFIQSRCRWVLQSDRVHCTYHM